MGKDFCSRKSKSDFFETPYSMTEQFLEVEKFDYNKTVLEPASGDLAIFKVLSDIGFLPIHGDLKYGFDFLKRDSILAYNNKPFDYIITNPPFSKWDKFVNKAKDIAIEKFAFLGKIEFLVGIDRFINNIYKDRDYPLTKIYIFTRQINLSFMETYPKLREDGKYPCGMYNMGWFVFERNRFMDKNTLNVTYKKFIPDPPIIKWIDNNKYILRKKDL